MIFKLIFARTFLFPYLHLSAQKVAVDDLKLNDSIIYFFLRGTKAKSVVIKHLKKNF